MPIPLLGILAAAGRAFTSVAATAGRAISRGIGVSIRASRTLFTSKPPATKSVGRLRETKSFTMRFPSDHAFQGIQRGLARAMPMVARPKGGSSLLSNLGARLRHYAPQFLANLPRAFLAQTVPGFRFNGVGAAREEDRHTPVGQVQQMQNLFAWDTPSVAKQWPGGRDGVSVNNTPMPQSEKDGSMLSQLYQNLAPRQFRT